jgi:hypothetical protein
MSQPDAGGPAAAGGACPNCQAPLTDGTVCWRCCDRLCARCGQPTGSAFILFCWPCSCRLEAEEAAAAPGRAAGTAAR